MPDNINHPPHYNQYKGLEVWDLVEQMNFNLGNAIKYISRAGHKDPSKEEEDLNKAIAYVQRELNRADNTRPNHDDGYNGLVLLLSSQVSTWRAFAINAICIGDKFHLQDAIWYLQEEIRHMSGA